MGVYDFDLESYIGLARRLGTDTVRTVRLSGDCSTLRR